MKSTNRLVIVESPTKAKTISRFLGEGYTVESSFGHVRDLPKSTLGVDVEHEFTPKYIVPLKAKKVVTRLKQLAAKAGVIYFATDEDREGEAIAWHLAELIKPKPEQIKRIVFHEITKSAVEEALKHPRDIDAKLVDAQQARRILDRLVGYKLSPLLWQKVAKGLSAGRVQSVAVRLIVEREREINAFQAQEFWTIDGMFAPADPKLTTSTFAAHLTRAGEQKLERFTLGSKDAAEAVLAQVRDSRYHVSSISRRAVSKRPLPPFTTSTLQQAANLRLGYSAKQTMRLAQQLYEGVELGADGHVGLITYMRTDSVNLAQKFLQEAEAHLKSTLGNRYAHGPRTYTTTSKGAQEAHEAIRPTEVIRTPDSVAPHLSEPQRKLYTLIWQRAVASQMTNADLEATELDLTDEKKIAEFRANGMTIRFDGYLKVYPTETAETILPALAEGADVATVSIAANQHFTKPPARYNEATLVKALEQRGIGRPSTYAPTIDTVQERGYVEKIDRRLKPTDMGTVVNDLLVEHFPQIVDYQFTAKMEADLDAVAEGKTDWHGTLQEFYTPFAANVELKTRELGKVEEASDAVCPKCGKPMVVKMGRFGKFLACTGYPECKTTQQIASDGKPEPLPTIDEVCPDCGKPLVQRRGRFGPFIGCSGYPDCKYIKKTPAKVYADCPICKTGKIVAKRSRRGMFYACDRYPDCKNAYNTAPTGETCPTCGNLLVFAKDDMIKCGNKECDFSKPAPMKVEVGGETPTTSEASE